MIALLHNIVIYNRQHVAERRCQVCINPASRQEVESSNLPEEGLALEILLLSVFSQQKDGHTLLN
jgi:hypothetical protein